MLRPQNPSDDLATVKAAGIDTVVSLLEPAEAVKAGLSAQSEACAALGLTFLNHPIRDMHLPVPDAFTAFATDIATRLQDGAHVAVHCFASIGRTGMLTCTVLGHFGYDAETAQAHVSKMRGALVPDTPQQTRFIKQIMSAQSI
jgi:protein-tyrosine phosphatase